MFSQPIWVSRALLDHGPYSIRLGIVEPYIKRIALTTMDDSSREHRNGGYHTRVAKYRIWL